jgi:uncharacterized protein YqhQ
VPEDKDKKFHYGGQAVIEGVMMRGKKDFAVCVRKADGQIVTSAEDVESIMGRFKFLDKPFLRGTLALIDSMALGIKALMFSANIAMDDATAQDQAAKSDDPTPPRVPSKVNDVAVKSIMVLGLVLGLALFMLVPIVITKQLNTMIRVRWELTLIEGVIKIGIFLGYIILISRMNEIRRVFQYHGAEHKTINAYEAGQPLEVENVMNYPKAHVRCGTSFILVVLVCSIVVFIAIADYLPHGTLAERSFISYWIRWGYKLALLPFVAGIAYEIIRFAGAHKDSALARALVYPGLLMQKLTTREPEPSMVEVAIKSLQSVFETEKSRSQEAEADPAKT